MAGYRCANTVAAGLVRRRWTIAIAALAAMLLVPFAQAVAQDAEETLDEGIPAAGRRRG